MAKGDNLSGPVAAARPKTIPRNTELEEAIVADPESPDGYLVYGDWLLEQGESLGDLVSVQAALAKRPKTAKLKAELQKKEKALLARHTESLGEFAVYEHTWKYGFLEGVTIENPTPQLYEELCQLVAARFLRELDIELLMNATKNALVLGAIARLGLPKALRKLALMSIYDAMQWADAGDISIIYPRLDRVRELVVRAQRLTLGTIDLPALESLDVTLSAEDGRDQSVEAGIVQSVTTWLTQKRPPALKRLSLAFGVFRAESLPWTRLAPLALALPPLEHLGLTEHSVGDDLVRALLDWKHLPRCTSLDLSSTDMTNAGAKLILENEARFSHLENLSLGGNALTTKTCKALEKAFDIAVDVESQGRERSFDRFVE